MTTTLTDFLLARIAEDEATLGGARVISEWSGEIRFDGERLYDDTGEDVTEAFNAWLLSQPLTDGARRWLAECEAKRRIIEHAHEANGLDLTVEGDRGVAMRDEQDDPYCGDSILKALALPYADHPDYDETWRP